MPDQVQVENGNVLTGLQRFVQGVGDRSPLLRIIAAGMYQSVRRTFREQGSPADSWAPLAPSTIRRAGSKASAGRKILILSGRLLNSIQAQETQDGVEIGTNLVYARVQQEGSADRGAAIGPQARIPDRSAAVPAYTFSRPFIKINEPHTFKNGRTVLRRRKMLGPGKPVNVGEHQRFQNIPARPFLVFRPDDEPRIEHEVSAFLVARARNAGLVVEGGL